ncbi:methenyltetrahydrofolate synthase domain-containing protein isoform X1 [Tachyglossus aculeatus]|uniref:methenyltetrahydrofolate synthase domain-containing protein isoform X1 n=1 Tax=Tachyglossus aculeatus TaxID=9261 RepID=UPI0018F62101|nr:methenyltetrahydrofolate synthase domain-containing protein isoform X1 [Tachyglossus aculeatus]
MTSEQPGRAPLPHSFEALRGRKMESVLLLRPDLTKQEIREKIWDFMEAQNLADFPRPVHHRIPNFKGSYQACKCIKELEGFARMRELKVDPDKPLEGVRLIALQARKTLLVPTPRLRTGLFNKIVPPPAATKDILRKCATSQGVKDYSVPIDLDSKVLVDLVVVGSVAVSEKGWRIGKGEGYADMEYAMMVSMGAVREDTPVITIVHDCQVVDISEELLGDHDLTVDYIFTPTRMIRTNCKRPKPQGILWTKISYEMMEQIPILKNLHFREKQAGKDVTLRDQQFDLSERKNKQAIITGTAPKTPRREAESAPVEDVDSRTDGLTLKTEMAVATTVYVGNIPQDARVSHLKRVLRERNAVPWRLNWQGLQHRAFLDYKDKVTAEAIVSSLKGLTLGGHTLCVELAKKQRIKRSGNE